MMRPPSKGAKRRPVSASAHAAAAIAKRNLSAAAAIVPNPLRRQGSLDGGGLGDDDEALMMREVRRLNISATGTRHGATTSDIPSAPYSSKYDPPPSSCCTCRDEIAALKNQLQVQAARHADEVNTIQRLHQQQDERLSSARHSSDEVQANSDRRVRELETEFYAMKSAATELQSRLQDSNLHLAKALQTLAAQNDLVAAARRQAIDLTESVEARKSLESSVKNLEAQVMEQRLATQQVEQKLQRSDALLARGQHSEEVRQMVLRQFKDEVKDLERKAKEQLAEYDAHLAEERRTHAAQVASLKRELREARADAGDMQNSAVEATAAKDASLSKLRVARDAKDESADRVAVLEGLLATRTEALRGAQERVRELEIVVKRRSTAEEEVNALVRRLGRSEAQCAAATARVADLQRTIDRLKGIDAPPPVTIQQQQQKQPVAAKSQTEQVAATATALRGDNAALNSSASSEDRNANSSSASDVAASSDSSEGNVVRQMHEIMQRHTQAATAAADQRLRAVR